MEPKATPQVSRARTAASFFAALVAAAFLAAALLLREELPDLFPEDVFLPDAANDVTPFRSVKQRTAVNAYSYTIIIQHFIPHDKPESRKASLQEK